MNGNGLRAQRKALGLTQKRLARALGYSRWSIIQFESGAAPIPQTVDLAVKELLHRHVKPISTLNRPSVSP